jgi:MFS family permease
VITTGMSLGCLALLNLSRLKVDSSYAGGVLPTLLVMGFAMGMVMAPAMNTATAGVKPQDAGVAAALVSTMQQIGGSIGTAVLSTITASVTAGYLVSHQGSGAIPAAATHGYVVAFLIVSGLFGAGAVMCGALFPSKTQIADIRAQATAGAHGAAPQVDGELAHALPVEV